MLTSLKNRNYLNEKMDVWNKNTIYPQAVIVIDLNNLKYINDTFGHEEGDKQIKASAGILIKTQLDNSEIMRTDGNEFMVYLVGYTEKQVINYIKKLVKEFKTLPYEYGAAIGFSMIVDDLKLLDDAINEGVRRGYTNGYLRKSVVKDPVRRGNTGDNTPAMIYTEIVPGDQVKVTVGPKGFGSENMSQIRMFKPSAGLQGIKDFILEVVETAGPNPCPPMVVGVGIGGTFDKCALLAKKALMRPLDTQNPDPFYADLEKEMLEKVNKLGIGPQGFGGKTTAIGLNIETMPTHIAGMPCAVNINCHVTRHKSEVI